mgnify:CR=1 FL=1
MSISFKPRLERKVCIVTGAGMHDNLIGTGMATAVSLAREGAKVLVADISEENAEKTAQQIRDEKIGHAEIYLGDATRTEDSEAMIAAALKYYGGLDVLVNNLGWGGKSANINDRLRSKGISEIDEQEWTDAFEMNLNLIEFSSRDQFILFICNSVLYLI